MKQNVTTREEILKICRKLIVTQGWGSLNIRNVASECKVSVGSVYNYFNSKSDLVFATVESVWADIFHGSEQEGIYQSFTKCITWIYHALEQGEKHYPDFYKLHILSLLKDENQLGRERMEKTWTHMKKGMELALKNDKNVRQNAFSESFTREDFINFIFGQILASLFTKDFHAEKVIEIIKRTVY